MADLVKVKLTQKAIVPRAANPQNADVVQAGETVEVSREHADHLIATGGAEKPGKHSDHKPERPDGGAEKSEK